MIRRPPRSTPKPSSAASDVYKRQGHNLENGSHYYLVYKVGLPPPRQRTARTSQVGRNVCSRLPSIPYLVNSVLATPVYRCSDLKICLKALRLRPAAIDLTYESLPSHVRQFLAINRVVFEISPPASCHGASRPRRCGRRTRQVPDDILTIRRPKRVMAPRNAPKGARARPTDKSPYGGQARDDHGNGALEARPCLLYTSPSPRDS